MTTFNNHELQLNMWVIYRPDGMFYEVGEILPHIIQLKQIVLTDDLVAYYTGRVQFTTNPKDLICID